MRRRPSEGEDIREVHDRLMICLAQLPAPWGLNGCPALDAGETGAAADLEGVLGPGVAGAVVYTGRAADLLADRSAADDVLLLEFDPAQDQVEHFIEHALADYLSCFGAYRAALIVDDDLDLDDGDAIADEAERTGLDIDGRDGVFRFWSVNFFDAELCRRSFNMTPEETARRVGGIVQEVKVLGDGVLIVGASGVPSRGELLELQARLQAELGRRGTPETGV